MKKLIITTLLAAGATLAAQAFAGDATPAPATPATPAAPAAAPAAGPGAKAIWDDQCAKCHGPEGKGDTKMGKKLDIIDLTDAKKQAGFTDEQAAKAIKDGTKDKDGEFVMKPIDGIKDEDIKALIPFVRSLAKK